jgi:hypothetical protein
MPPTVMVAGAPYPLTLSTAEAAEWLGCAEDSLPRLRGTGKLPVEPLPLGRNLRWPTFAIARAAGLPAEVVVDAASSRPDAADGEVHELPSGV